MSQIVPTPVQYNVKYNPFASKRARRTKLSSLSISQIKTLKESPKFSQTKTTITMSYKAGIAKAITELKDRTGSSSIAIKKHMQANLPADKKWMNATFLKALKDMVASGELVKTKASYKLSAVAKQKASSAGKPKKAPKKKVAPKKTAPKKKSAPKKKAAPKKAATAKKPAAKKTAIKKTKKPAAKKAAPANKE
eukprot:g390.t1 g390   contig1:944977-946168(-)